MCKDQFKKLSVITASLMLLFTIACDLGDDDEDEDGTGTTYTEQYGTSPSDYTHGVGIDFETNTSSALDEYDLIAYDIRVQTIKGVKDDGTKKGAPHIKLYKQSATGYQYTSTGKTAFEAITLSDVVENSLAPDAVEEIDGNAIVYATGTTYEGQYSYNLLNTYYDNNFVTKASSNWLPTDWVIGEDEVIFIIKTAEGNYYKMMVLGMGPEGTGSGSQPGSGTIEISFAKIAN